MIPQVKIWTREEMMKRVAPFAELKGFSDGLQVLKNAMRPRGEVTFDHFHGGRVEWNLSGHEQQVARLHGLGIGTDC